MSSSWITSVIDWDTCKMQFEVLGDSLERIAIVHDLPLDSLKRIATDENWVAQKPSSANLNNYLAEVVGSHRAKLSLAALYRDMELFPRVVAAENALLDKITLAIINTSIEDPRAASALRALGQGLNAIAERKVLGTVDEDERDEIDTNWSVEIKKSEQALQLVEREIKAAGIVE